MSKAQSQSWRTLASRTLVDSPPWLVLREDRVSLPTGTILDPYYVVEAPDWSCVVPVLGTREVVMVEQWRHAIGRPSLEFPAGAVDAGETPEAAAIRETREEAGVETGRLEPLATVATEPARMTNWAHLFLAPEARIVGDPVHDVGEDLRVRRIAASDLAGLVARGEIVHGVHVAAALLAAAHLMPNHEASGDVDGVLSQPRPSAMTEELSTILVSVNVGDSEEARIQKIQQHVGDGWTVVQSIPVSGGGIGPGGESEDFLRLQVTLRRELDADGVVVGADRTGASGLSTQPASAAFDPPFASESDASEPDASATSSASGGDA